MAGLNARLPAPTEQSLRYALELFAGAPPDSELRLGGGTALAALDILDEGLTLADFERIDHETPAKRRRIVDAPDR